MRSIEIIWDQLRSFEINWDQFRSIDFWVFPYFSVFLIFSKILKISKKRSKRIKWVEIFEKINWYQLRSIEINWDQLRSFGNTNWDQLIPIDTNWYQLRSIEINFANGATTVIWTMWNGFQSSFLKTHFKSNFGPFFFVSGSLRASF